MPTDLLGRLEQRATAAVVVHRIRTRMVNLQHGLERDLALAFVNLGERAGRAAEDVLSRRRQEVYEAAWRTLTHAQVDDLINAILNATRLHGWAADKLTPAFEKWWAITAAYTGRELVQQGIISQVRPTIASRMLEAGGLRKGLLDIEGDTKAALFRALDHAREAGLNPREVAKLVQGVVPEGRFVHAGPAYRSQLIARTEMRSAANRSSIEHYRTTNVIQHVVAFDGDSDEECAVRNGSIFTLDEAEIEDANTHPNCVLAFGPVAS
jgi:SPP1 gp7 family putative phage head morphogenesis protein